jgi:hypothetical protein
MSHPIHRVTEVQLLGPYILDVQFADGTTQKINFQPVLEGEIYGPLRDLSLFEQVKVDPEIHTLVWPNGADFDPATLHDWPAHEQAFSERAQHWEAAGIEP